MTAFPGWEPQAPQNPSINMPPQYRSEMSQPGALDSNRGRREPARGPCLGFPICKWRVTGEEGFLRCSHPRSFLLQRSRRRPPRLHDSGALSGSPGDGEVPGMGKPGLTSAGSAPRGPGRLRAGVSNGPARRARWPR